MVFLLRHKIISSPKTLYALDVIMYISKPIAKKNAYKTYFL